MKNILLSVAAGFVLASCDQSPGHRTEDAQSGAADAVDAVRADAELIPRELIFGNPTYSSVQISPDGSMVSYLAPVDGVMNIWVAPSDDIAAAKSVTSDTGRGIRSYGWVAGMNRIVYIQDKGGDENFLLYGVDPATSLIIA